MNVDALEMIVRGRGSPVPGRLLISPSELHALLDAARKAEAAEAERDQLREAKDNWHAAYVEERARAAELRVALAYYANGHTDEGVVAREALGVER